jgi:hypothetical protein
MLMYLWLHHGLADDAQHFLVKQYVVDGIIEHIVLSCVSVVVDNIDHTSKFKLWTCIFLWEDLTNMELLIWESLLAGGLLNN